MAYMGLGLQKWIYSRNPRNKLFVREGLASFTALPKYYRTFKLQPSVKENKRVNGALTLFIVVAFSIALNFIYIEFVEYSNTQTSLKEERIKIDSHEAFKFLFNSGKNRLIHNNIAGAYSEFKLAYAIHPKNQELNQLIIETLSILCSNNYKYCSELDSFLQKSY